MCDHDLAEREAACADGMCPICLAAETAKLEKQKKVISDHADMAANEAERLEGECNSLRAKLERARECISDLIPAITAEVNEKGAGGYLLARLTDARATLEEIKE